MVVQVGLALLEDTLLPVLVYLWRDERSLYLRRQSELWKFGEDQPDNCIMYLISLQQSHLPVLTASYRSELKQADWDTWKDSILAKSQLYCLPLTESL